MEALYGQGGYGVRFDWSADGLAALADCAVLVIVDVLSFSTSATIAVEGGAEVLPLRYRDEAHERFAAAGFAAERACLPATLPTSVSGRELIEKGHGGDVELAATLNASTTVPELRDGVLRG